MRSFRYGYVLIGLFVPLMLAGQNNTGGASFLMISPDVRSAGMGEAGVAARPGVFSVYRNPGQAPFAEPGIGIAAVFSPWMQGGEENRFLYGTAGYYRSGKHAVMADFRLFKHPSSELVDEQGNYVEDFTPREKLFSLGYARQIVAGLGIGMNVKYIVSDFEMGGKGKIAETVAFDLGIYYRRKFAFATTACWSVGIKMSDLGGQLDYGYGKYELPGRMTVGGAIGIDWGGRHDLEGVLDFGYLFMPENSNTFSCAAGLGYRYAELVALRIGYHGEGKEKGRGNFVTTGAGISWKKLTIDGSYILAEKDNLLRNSWMLSVGFHFGLIQKR